jgi:cell division protein FtsQ
MSINLRRRTRKLEANPWIHKVVIKRKLPCTIEINVEERKQLAVIELDGYYLVDSHGEIFKKAEQNELNHPLLSGLDEKDFILNKNESVLILNSALNLIKSLKEKNMFDESSIKISMDKIFGNSLHNSADNLEIILGFEPYAKKLIFLHKIMDDLQEKGLKARTINLNSDNKAYVKIEERRDEKEDINNPA